MCLRKSPFRSPASLAANRSNSLKSTGPRTAEGKARSSLNALKHGGYACRLPARLRAAGYGERAALHQTAYQEICGAFRPKGPEEWAQAVRLANNVVAMAEQAGVLGTKPECPLFSARLGPRFHSLFPIRVDDPGRGIGLVFWVQRKGYWTLPKLLRKMLGDRSEEESRRSETGATGCSGDLLSPTAGELRRSENGSAEEEPPLRLALECRVRHRVFRMRRLTGCERVKNGLERSGTRVSRVKNMGRMPMPPPTELERALAMIRAAKLMPHECY